MQEMAFATRQASIGDYAVTYTDHTIQMPEWAIKHMLAMLAVWPTHFPITQPTWVSEVLGLPTILMRFDCVLDEETKKLGVFELEERPEGMGLSTLLHDTLPANGFAIRMQELLQEWQAQLGHIVFLESPCRERSSDDAYFARRFGLPYVLGTPEPNGVLYYVRADRTDNGFYQYAPRSLSTIEDEGSKAYGVGMKLWASRPAQIDELPWQDGFALKESHCSRFNGTYLYHKNHRRHGVAPTESRARRELGEHYQKFTFCQKWIEPETSAFMPDGWKMMRRFFFGFSPKKCAWIPLGGCWLTRKNVRMHGASDAVFGPLTVSA